MMPCYYPRSLVSGQVVQCGRCVHCKLRYSYDWAVRGQHEASLYTENSFITLTYDDRRLPPGYDIRRGLAYSHFKQFIKDFRSRCGGRDAVAHPKFGKWDNKHNKPYPEFHRPIRHMSAGEYGELNKRPHWHSCIFNFGFSDRRLWMERDGFPVYRSATLEELWPWGNSEIGSVTFKSAGYVARYVMKKASADSSRYNTVIDGVPFVLPQEIFRMSTNPGIGDGWFRKFHSDVFPCDYVVLDGRPRAVPRFYDRKFAKANSFKSPSYIFWEGENRVYYDSQTGEIPMSDRCPELDNIKFDRCAAAKDSLDNFDRPSLSSQEQVQLAKLSRLKRTLT